MKQEKKSKASQETLELLSFNKAVLSVFKELGDLRKNLEYPANKKAFKFAKVCSDAFYQILNID